MGGNMALTRTDEMELLTALHDGLHETPRWGSFLERLRRRTRADYASLIFSQGQAPIHRATQVHAGRDVRARAHEFEELARLDPIPYERLRPGRVYAPEELIDAADPRHDRFRHEYLNRIGVGHGRFMRVTEPGGTSAWAVLLRDKENFTASDSAILAALQPHLSIALRNFAVLERERLRAHVSEDVLRRAGLAWAVLGNDGAVQLSSSAAGPMLSATGARISAGSVEAERRLARLVELFTAQPDAPPQLAPLDDDEDGALIALPIAEKPLTAPVMPAYAAVARLPRTLDNRHARLLAARHGLSASEAGLALALARGRSIAEAAATLRLSLETARNYSKRIYAKTGTRGQADLVRVVLDSVTLLA
ncbi:LuxR family transcriptional regulator [Sphingomonas sp. C8-2]|nr:LuxR family transcriptional regulator [Sphingomonas sp. C8-2]